MANNRVFYATQQVAIKDNAAPATDEFAIDPLAPSGKWEFVHGIQSVSVTTTFNTEDVFELGQIEIYETLENQPDIEVSIERVLDGTKPLWLMTTASGTPDLVARTADFKCDLMLSIFPDTNTKAFGDADTAMLASGIVVSSVTYTLGVDGNFTESVTLVGNDKVWGNTGSPTPEGYPSGFFATNTPELATVVGSGVLAKQDFDTVNTILPSGTGGIPITDANCLQSVTISLDLGREDIFCLGTKRPTFRTVTFPIEVTTAIEVITTEGDKVDARSDQDNLVSKIIDIYLDDGMRFNLGSNNVLTSVEFGGGDAGGGNVAVTYNFKNNNEFTVTHDGFPGL